MRKVRRRRLRRGVVSRDGCRSGSRWGAVMSCGGHRHGMRWASAWTAVRVEADRSGVDENRGGRRYGLRRAS